MHGSGYFHCSERNSKSAVVCYYFIRAHQLRTNQSAWPEPCFGGINDQFQDILFVLWKKIWFLNILLFSYSHSDEPLFPCDLCGKKFWGKRQRTHHILATHENKRDHICTYCGKGFHTKAKMIRHSEVVSIVTTECYMLDWFK